MQNQKYMAMQAYIRQDSHIDWQNHDIPESYISHWTPGMLANRDYYNHPEWIQGYLDNCHRDRFFRDCWQAAIGCWDHKIVVDIGCGPGNLYATLGGSPKLLIGVDIARNSLLKAEEIGYVPILADAQNLPFMDGFADIVVINATLHHCDDMIKTLTEAARLVRPGGLLVTDHDPQKTAWDWRGVGMFFYKIRVPIYRLITFGKFMSKIEHEAMIASETHHRPGDGVNGELYHHTLSPLGFSVQVYPHNHTVGAKVLQGDYGKSDLKYRIGQFLSGINPNTPEAALSLMCIAKRDRIH